MPSTPAQGVKDNGERAWLWLWLGMWRARQATRAAMESCPLSPVRVLALVALEVREGLVHEGCQEGAGAASEKQPGD